MRRHLPSPTGIAFLALLMIGELVSAQTPPPVAPPRAVVAGPTDLVPYKSAVFFDATKSISAYPLKWSISPSAFTLTFDKDGRKDIAGFVTPPLAPDTQYVLTITALGKTTSGDPDASSTTLIFRTEPDPTKKPPVVPPVSPPVDPTPTDPPVNPPVVGKLYTLLVYKGGEQTTLPLRIGPLANPTSAERQQLTALDSSWFAVDERAKAMRPDGTVSPNLFLDDWQLSAAYALGKSPTLFIVGADGKLLKQVSPAPTTPADIIAAVTAVRQGK